MSVTAGSLVGAPTEPNSVIDPNPRSATTSTFDRALTATG